MFIVKLAYDDNIKKIKFQDEYRDINVLKKVVQDITRYENFTMSFVDLENEKLYLEDNHDMEYFLAQSEDKSKRIFIEQIQKENKEEFKELLDQSENCQEIKEEKPDIDKAKIELIKELQDLFVKEENSNQIRENTDVPKIYQKNNKKIEKVEFPKKVKKIKKKKDSQQLLSKLNKTIIKTEKQLMKKLQKMKRQIKLIESIKNNEEKERKPKIIDQPKKNGIRVLTQHLGFVCDKCQQGPIVGIRYHCIVCQDYDLCQNCEQSNFHSHPMIRIMNQQSKKQIEQHLTNYLDQNELTSKMEIENENKSMIEKLDKEKMDLLDFIFPNKDIEAQRELIRRFRHLNLEEFYQKVSAVMTQF